MPGFNVPSLAFEARQVRIDNQGMRLGDRLAGTQVVQGKDAIDLVKTVLETVGALKREIRGASQPVAESYRFQRKV